MDYVKDLQKLALGDGWNEIKAIRATIDDLHFESTIVISDCSAMRLIELLVRILGFSDRGMF